MRLRVLVGAAGTPRLVTREPFDVLENGVAGARWTVGDPSPGVPVNEARAVLLGVLQARAGGPPNIPRRVLVRLPRRLSGPRLHGGRGQPTVVARESWGSAKGWAEAIRWLRGILPTPPERPSSERIARAADLVHVELVLACWELSYPGAGLGLPKPLPRRRRRWQTIARSGDIAGRRLDMVVYDDLLPGPLSNSEAVAREIGQVVAAAGGKASDVRVEGDQVHFTATIERPLDEAPELPRLGPNDPNPWGVDPTPEPIPVLRPPRATLAALRRARAELDAQGTPTNEDGTYNVYLGSEAMYELRSDPEFQRMSMGLLYDNQEADGSILSISGLRLFERRGTGWSVEPGGVRVDFRIDLNQSSPMISFGPGLRQTAPHRRVCDLRSRPPPDLPALRPHDRPGRRRADRRPSRPAPPPRHGRRPGLPACPPLLPTAERPSPRRAPYRSRPHRAATFGLGPRPPPAGAMIPSVPLFCSENDRSRVKIAVWARFLCESTVVFRVPMRDLDGRPAVR